MLSDRPAGLNPTPAAVTGKKSMQPACPPAPLQLDAKWANKVLEAFVSAEMLDNVITPDGDVLLQQ